MPLLAGCFASSLKIRNRDRGADRTGKPLGRNQPSTWTKSTQGRRAKALKKLGKSEGFWPSWRREKEGDSLPRCKKENEKKKKKSKKQTLETVYKYNWISRLFTSVLQVVGWTRLYLFKTSSRFSCVRAYLVYSGDLLLSLIDTVEKFFQLLNLHLGVLLLIFQILYCFLCFPHQLWSCFSKKLFFLLVAVLYIFTPKGFNIFPLQCIPAWYLQFF